MDNRQRHMRRSSSLFGRQKEQYNSYTVSYSTKSHLSVLFQRWGSIWPEVLPYCIWNLVMDLLLQNLKDRGVINLAFSDKGHLLINFIMGFLLVSRISQALSRYYEVRKDLDAMFSATRQLVQKACVYSVTKGETQVAQKEWRNKLAFQMMMLLRAVMTVLDYPSTQVDVWKQLPCAKLRAEIEEKLFIRTKRYKHDVKRGLLEENLRVPNMLTYKVRSTILEHNKVFQNPLIIHQEMALQTSVDNFMSAWTGVRCFLTSPHPFPLVQMSRTFLFFYVFTTPFALLSDVTCTFGHAITVFFLTFGFVGMEVVSMHLDDPFGNDQDDFDNLGFAQTVFENIYLDIEEADGEEYAQKLRAKLENNFDNFDNICQDNKNNEETPLIRPVLTQIGNIYLDIEEGGGEEYAQKLQTRMKNDFNNFGYIGQDSKNDEETQFIRTLPLCA